MQIGVQLRCGFELLDLLPVVRLIEGRCENEDCGEVHGWALELGWLCFGLLITLTKGQGNG